MHDEMDNLPFPLGSSSDTEVRSALSEMVNGKPPALREVDPKTGFGRLYDWLAHETDDPAYDPELSRSPLDSAPYP